MLAANASLASVNHRFFWCQSLVQALLILLSISQSEAGGAFLSLFAIVALVFVGVPHGGNDFFYRPNKSVRGSLLFLLYYLGSMALYAALWFVFPLLALLLFLVISMHHFGQSNFLSDRWFVPESLLWGGWLLVYPVLMHLPEAMAVFSQMLGNPTVQNYRAWQLSPGMLLLIALAYGLVYAWILNRRNIAHRWQYLLQWILVSVWYGVSPLILGFVVVFCLWHAGQSMRYQVVYILRDPDRSMGRVLMGFMPLGFVALLAWVVMSVWTTQNALSTFSFSRLDESMPLGLGFVLLSLVTLPHVVVMDGIYRTESHR